MTMTLDTPPAAKQSLWRHGDFRRLWIGETTSKLGTRITSVALPLVAIVTLEASPFAIGLLAVASWLPWLLIGLPAGAWVDRLPRRELMIVCNLVSLALILSIPVMAWLGALSVTYLLVAALLVGTADVFFTTAYAAFLPALLTPERLPEGNAKLQGAAYSADIVGPGLAGLITNAVGALGGLVVDAATFMVSTVYLLRMKTREKITVSRQRRSLRSEIGEGLRFVAGDGYLRSIAISGAAANLALTGYNSIMVLFLVREIGLSPGVLGAVLMAMSSGGVVGALLSNRVARRFGTAHGALYATFLGSPFALLIPLTGNGWRLGFAIAGGMIIGVSVGIGNVIKSSFRQMYTPPPLLGRVMVSMQFVNFGTIPLGGLLGGVLASTIGIRPTLWVMTAAVALAPLILLIGPIRLHRDLPVAHS